VNHWAERSVVTATHLARVWVLVLVLRELLKLSLRLCPIETVSYPIAEGRARAPPFCMQD